jgi:hypothetical protein
VGTALLMAGSCRWHALGTVCRAVPAPQVNHRMWSSQSPLRQFKGLPAELLTRLEKKVRVRMQHACVCAWWRSCQQPHISA